MNSAIKKCLCMAINQSSVVIQPHPSQYVFCKGKCTVSLQTLVSGLQAAGIQHVTLVAYGMKMNYSECLFFDEFNGLALQRRYDIGRNISTKSIPVFGLFDVQGTVYPVFDNLGAGYGSVEIPLDSPNNRLYSITLKCYPRLLHQLKSHKLTINPTNPISLNPNNPESVPSPGLETAKMRGGPLLNLGGHGRRVGRKKRPPLTMSGLLRKSHAIGQADSGNLQYWRPLALRLIVMTRMWALSQVR